MTKSWLRGEFLIVPVCVVLAGTPAGAGVVDSPLPVFQGGAIGRILFTIPGVIKNNNIETIVSCTSLEQSRVITVAVEVFDATGTLLNDASAPSLDGAETLAPGETATIATGNTLAFHEDEIIDSLGPASVRNGSARIVSDSKKVTCSAFLVDELNDPPSSMGTLTIISKAKKQRGD